MPLLTSRNHYSLALMSYKSISALMCGLRFRHRGLGVATVLIVYVRDELFAAATQNSLKKLSTVSLGVLAL